MGIRSIFRRRPLTGDDRRKRDDAKLAWKEIRKRRRELAWRAGTGLPTGPDDPADDGSRGSGPVR